MAGRDDEDRLGGRSDALAGRGGGHGGGAGPIRRYRDEDRGEDPADHFRGRGGQDVAQRLGGADTGTLRAQDHRGRGPKGYRRSDDRIKEDVNDRLADDPYVDASGIEVSVSGGEVTLAGTVDSRQARRRAEDIAEGVSGVTHVQNNIRVRQAGQGYGTSYGTGTSSGLGTTSGTSGSGGTSASSTSGQASRAGGLGESVAYAGESGSTGTTGSGTSSGSSSSSTGHSRSG